MRCLPITIAASVLVFIACNSEGDPTLVPDASASEVQEQTASLAPAQPGRTPLVPQTRTPTPTTISPTATVWLADVETGALKTLSESLGSDTHAARFTSDGGILLQYNAQGAARELTFDAQGNRLEDAPVDRTVAHCVESESGAQVADRLYLGARCGLISPNGRFMTYAVDAGEVEVDGRYSVPSWDQWVVDLEMGILRRLQAGMRSCGGCD